MAVRDPRFTEHDLLSGIASCIAGRGYKSFTADERRWARALAAAMPFIRQEAKKLGLHPNFQIHPHPIHGSSQTVKDALYGLRVRGLATLDFPASDVYRPKMEATDAQTYVTTFAGGRKFYEAVTSKVLEELDKPEHLID